MANQNDVTEPVVKTIKRRRPKWVICPACGLRQPFKKKKEHYKKVKDMDINRPVILRIQVIYAKCKNGCPSFALSTSGIERYQRTTSRLKQRP